MPESSDDAYKDLMDIIHQIITTHVSGERDKKLPPIMGIKFVLNGGTVHLASIFPQAKIIPLEIFEDTRTIIIQTELPSECPDDFFIAYQEGKLQLNAGSNREYSATIPVAEIDPSLTETHLHNGVLEIICFKKI
ncbi:MAG TPA: hypothetical protein O0W91_02260 [Methanocorpusculum sp.]|nr:hypothetical protein [Methanocorpusculum sp.]HJK02072.1 hypothetical protein [Methanocorpusculum sp.]